MPQLCETQVTRCNRHSTILIGRNTLTQQYQRIGFCSAVCYMPTLRKLDSVTMRPEVKPFRRRIGHLYDTMDTHDGDKHELPPVLT